MSVDLFTKGSVWRTGSDLKVRGTVVPAGTEFEVVYPRRRETELVAVKFADTIRFPRSQKGRTSVPRSRTKKPRFHLADELLWAKQLHDATLVQESVVQEYFIREIATGKLWAGSMRTASNGIHRTTGFHDVPFVEANHYVSPKNARIGVINILFGRYAKLAIPVVPQWEIVEHDPISTNTRAIPLTQTWWSTILELAALDRKVPHETKRKPAAGTIFRKIANAVPDDGCAWAGTATMVSVNRFPKQQRITREKMDEVGITDFIKVDSSTFLLRHDADRVMMKLLFAEQVDTHLLIKESSTSCSSDL